MKKYGGFIPGIRAGQPTEDYLSYVLSRITLQAPLPRPDLAHPAHRPRPDRAPIRTSRSAAPRILIMVGVALDTVKQIESQFQQRNYEGFLRYE